MFNDEELCMIELPAITPPAAPAHWQMKLKPQRICRPVGFLVWGAEALWLQSLTIGMQEQFMQPIPLGLLCGALESWETFQKRLSSRPDGHHRVEKYAKRHQGVLHALNYDHFDFDTVELGNTIGVTVAGSYAHAVVLARMLRPQPDLREASE